MIDNRLVSGMILIMLFLGMNGAVVSHSLPIENNNLTSESTLFETYSSYFPSDEKIEHTEKNINLPWKESSTGLLEWWVRIVYDEKTFEQQVPIDITDFREKFLKHPEYGEILTFDIDDDAEDDIEIIVGFYWSIIINANGREVKSLEKRIRVRQLASGEYLEDNTAEMQVWSELRVNYGIFKTSRLTQKESIDQHQLKSNPTGKSSFPYYKFISHIKRFQRFFNFINSVIGNQNSEIMPLRDVLSIPTPTADDNDYIAVGAGYRSAEGEDIPRYTEKRFSFGREKIFGPTIFQHQMDPGFSKGKDAIELIYGFQAYQSGSSNPSYDIEFSVEFNPAVYLKTKFIPAGGYVYYYFNEASQQNKQTEVTFTSTILKGLGEDVELSLIFDAIDDSLGRTGRWMSFDLDMTGDHRLLGGCFHYDASHTFSIGLLVNSPVFKEKVELLELPTRIDCAWDLNLSLNPTPFLYAHAEGYIDLSMNSKLGGINLYYPKTEPSVDDKIFIDVPGGLPKSTRIEAGVTLNMDITNLQNNENYIYGKIKHTCSDNIGNIRAFLPEEDIPLVNVTEIPAYSEAKAKLAWNNLKGYATATRNSNSGPDPIEINLAYKGYQIHDILTLRDGYLDTRFHVANDGYFYFDTSEGFFGNDLEVSNTDSGDSLSLFVDEVSAEEFQADWDFDTSSDSLNIPKISFNGMVDRLKNLEIAIDYQGKHTDLFLDWTLRQNGSFLIDINQDTPLTLDFDQFGLESDSFTIGGGITISDHIAFDMSWLLQQGEQIGGNVYPGYFTINKENDQTNLINFDFYLLYQNQYGINISLENIKFYLDFEWWKGDRLFPYIWLDYEVSSDDFDINLLWTNAEGQTQWYESVEEW